MRKNGKRSSGKKLMIDLAVQKEEEEEEEEEVDKVVEMLTLLKGKSPLESPGVTLVPIEERVGESGFR